MAGWDILAHPKYQFVKKSLFFRVSFLDQQDGDFVANRVNAVTRAAFELVLFLVVSKRRFARGTGENFQQITADHSGIILTPDQSLVRRIESRRERIPTLSPAKRRPLG